MSDLVSGQQEQVLVMGWFLFGIVICDVVRCGRFGVLVIFFINLHLARS